MTRHLPGLYLDGRGHEEIRCGSASLKHHRLVAYAHGIIDSLDDPRDIHHIDGCRTNNGAANLEAVDPSDHVQITVANAKARKARADGRNDPVTDGGIVLADPSDMVRCDGCGVMTAAPSRYGRMSAGTGPYTVAYCTRCESLRTEHGIRPERHPQYKLPEVCER